MTLTSEDYAISTCELLIGDYLTARAKEAVCISAYALMSFNPNIQKGIQSYLDTWAKQLPNHLYLTLEDKLDSNGERIVRVHIRRSWRR